MTDPSIEPRSAGVAGGPSHAPVGEGSDAPDADVLPGAEPLSVEGGSAGALVLHGFTGCPQSVRGLAEALVDAGFTVEMPRLPGHGTSLDDMLTTDWDDWSAAADDAYQRLAHRCDRVVVAGLSMGGTLSLWLATRHPAISGVALVNPACPPPGPGADEQIQGLEALAQGGVELVDSIGGDLADPDAHELAYGQAPVVPLISLLRAGRDVAGRLGDIRCPVLLMNSPEDHVVSPEHSEHIAASIGGEVERVTLERSYHVATLDHDKELVQERTVEFAHRTTSP